MPIPGEVWKEVPGYDERYLVSNKGRFQVVRPFRPIGRRGKWQKPGVVRGDKNLSLFKEDGSSRRVSLSVLILEVFVGPRPPGMSCLHWDDNRDNNAVENLRWGNHSENGHDRFRNGGIPARGERHRDVKMSDEDVREARRLKVSGWSVKALCERYGLTSGPMSLLLRGLTWKHV